MAQLFHLNLLKSDEYIVLANYKEISQIREEVLKIKSPKMQLIPFSFIIDWMKEIVIS